MKAGAVCHDLHRRREPVRVVRHGQGATGQKHQSCDAVRRLFWSGNSFWADPGCRVYGVGAWIGKRDKSHEYAERGLSLLVEIRDDPSKAIARGEIRIFPPDIDSIDIFDQVERQLRTYLEHCCLFRARLNNQNEARLPYNRLRGARPHSAGPAAVQRYPLNSSALGHWRRVTEWECPCHHYPTKRNAYATSPLWVTWTLERSWQLQISTPQPTQYRTQSLHTPSPIPPWFHWWWRLTARWAVTIA